MRETTRSAVLAGLAVLAVALAAATLDSTVVTERPGPEGPDGVGGEGSGGGIPLPRSEATPGEALQIPFLAELLTILTALVVLVTVAYAFVHWRRALGVVLAGVVLFGLASLLFRFLSSPPPPLAPPMTGPGNGSALGGGGGGGGSDAIRTTAPSVALLFVLGLAVLGTVVALVGGRGDGSGEISTGTDEGGAEAAAVGRAAGRAADRLEETADAGNEVYRTWREMTELLDVDDPGTSTPGEFAAAAVEAGLGREDVDELTRLFEDVRYGETRPSEEHERRAIAVFRRIEDRYAGEGP
jgi:hypothetical protein